MSKKDLLADWNTWYLIDDSERKKLFDEIDKEYKEAKNLEKTELEILLLKRQLNQTIEDRSNPIKPVDGSLLNWPDYFGWSEEGNSYIFEDNNELTFNASKSIRKIIFREIIDNKGGWVLVKDLAIKIDRSKQYIRDVIRQLNKLITSQGLDRYLHLQERNQIGKEGAYRAVAFPKRP